MINQRGLIHLLLLVLIGAILIDVFVYYRTNYLSTITNYNSNTAAVKPIAKKIYSDNDIGFSVEYPTSGYTFIKDSEASYFKRNGSDFRTNFINTWGYNPPDLKLGIVLKANNSEDLNNSSFTLWVFDNPKNLSVREWYKNYWYYPFVWGEYEPTKSQEGPDQESSVSGQIANYKLIGFQPGTPKLIYLPYKGKIFLFRIVKSNGTEANLGDKILASFKLTN